MVGRSALVVSAVHRAKPGAATFHHPCRPRISLTARSLWGEGVEHREVAMLSKPEPQSAAKRIPSHQGHRQELRPLVKVSIEEAFHHPPAHLVVGQLVVAAGDDFVTLRRQRAVGQTYLDASCWIASSDAVGASPDRRRRTDKSHQRHEARQSLIHVRGQPPQPPVSGCEGIKLSVQHDSRTLKLLSDLTVKVEDVVLDRHLEATRHE